MLGCANYTTRESGGWLLEGTEPPIREPEVATEPMSEPMPEQMPKPAPEPTAAQDSRQLVLSADPLATAQRLLSGQLVLTPNERAANALAGPAAEHLSLQETATRYLVNRAGLWRATPEAQVAALRQALAETDATNDVRGLSRALAPAVRELLRAGLGRAEVEAELARSAPSLGARAQLLLTVTRRYREVLARTASVDPAESLWRAADQIADARRVLVYGYSRLGFDELRFVDALAAPGSVVVLPHGFGSSDIVAEHLAALGWSVSREPTRDIRLGVELGRRLWPAQGSADPDPAITPQLAGASGWRAGDQEEEARFVLGRVKSLLASGVSASDIVLVARDEDLYGPLLAAVAREYRVPLTLSYTVPLRRARVGGFLALLAEVVAEGLPYELTARLLSHRFVRLLGADAWRIVRERRPEGLPGWREAVPGVEALAALDWPRTATYGGYLELLERTVEGLGALRHIHSSQREDQSWRELRAALERPEMRAAELGRGEFIAELGDALELHEAPADSQWTRGVELHSPLAIAGASYRHVFVLGAAEGVLPAPVSDDPMLDFFERAALRAAGLPLEDAPEAAEREVLSFLPVLLAAGGSLSISYPELLEGREQLASPYFASLGLTIEPVPARATASEPERLALTLQGAEGDHPAARAWRVELTRESAAPPDGFDGVIGSVGESETSLPLERRTYSATQLLTLGQCPFRWFSQRLLKLREPGEKEDEAGPATIGSLFHKALQLAVQAAQAGTETGDSDSLRRAVLEHLPGAFARAEAIVGTPATPTWPRQRPAHLRTLTEAVCAPDFLLDGSSVLLTEAEFSGTWRGLDVTGFVDRIDTVTSTLTNAATNAVTASEAGEGEERALVLTDYKLGKSKPLGAKDSSGKPTLDVQLPLYVETAAPELAPGLPVRSARYFSLNGATTIAEASIDDAELEALMARLRRHLADGSFPVEPDSEQKVCAYCDYDLVCRRGPRLGRKLAARADAQGAAGE